MLLYYGNAGILIFNQKNRLNRVDLEYSETEFVTIALWAPGRDRNRTCNSKTRYQSGFQHFGAQNRNRTCTPLRVPDFESDASTSSAIWAMPNFGAVKRG